MTIAEDVAKHYKRIWGEPARSATFRLGGHRIDVLKWDATRNPEQVNLYASVGASAHIIAGQPATHRQEFFVGLKPARDEIARSLALLALEPALNRRNLGHGQTVTYPDPLWPGTEMRTFLVIEPTEKLVPDLVLADGTHVKFLQAIPLHSAELAYKAQHSVDRLLERWKSSGVAFWDPTRKSEPSSVESGRVRKLP